MTPLTSATNFRDIAGPGLGYRVPGGRMRPGVVYRSNELVLSTQDVEAVRRLGVRQIFDLRTSRAVSEYPDSVVPGAEWIHLGIHGMATNRLVEAKSAADVLEATRQTYLDFVRLDASRRAFGDLLARLAKGEAPQLFHCTAGKDRTGWATALIHAIIGVDHSTLIKDYLMTNARPTSPPDLYLRRIVPDLDPATIHIYEVSVLAKEVNLMTGFAAAKDEYGGLMGYISNGLELEQSTLDLLRLRLIESDAA